MSKGQRQIMKAGYALIPAALLVGAVVSASANAKSNRVEDPGAHTRQWNARQEYFKSSARMRLAKRLGRFAKAQNGKQWNRTSAKPRPLAYQENDKIARLAPATEIARIATPKETVVTPKEAVVAPTEAVVAPKEAVVAPTEAVVAPTEADAALKVASIARMATTKTLRSGPRELPKPVASVAIAAPQFRIKPNETSGTAYVADIIRELAPSYGVPTWFALRIAMVESGYDPYALGLAGEIGVYQLKCETARVMGFMGECFRLTDARTNVRWGLKHLSLAIGSSGGDLQLAASKHNGGLGSKSLVDSYVAKVWLSSRRCNLSQIPGEACIMSLSEDGAVFGQADHP
jgi:soluble lytic murein transglycosylase-like protein